MISHLHGQKAPFELTDQIVYFHDWRYVFGGSLVWGDSDGNPLALMGIKPHPPVTLKQWDIPSGIKIVAQEANKTEPFITSEEIDELIEFGGTIINDDGLYRLWYSGRSDDKLNPGVMYTTDTNPQLISNGNLLLHEIQKKSSSDLESVNRLLSEEGHVCYAESTDAINWKFPDLDLLKIKGSNARNIVFDRGVDAGQVFIDPSAKPSEKYKMVYRGGISAKEFKEYIKKRPDDVDTSAFKKDGAEALLGAVSPDGINWTKSHEPLLIQFCDVNNICEYDTVRQKYVTYVRSWYFNRRSIARTESDTFGNFPAPTEVFWTNSFMNPYESWYANSKTKIPGTSTYHVMFPKRWNLSLDQFDFHLAASPDNVVWGAVPGGPVCKPGNLGTWDGGVVDPAPDLLELPGDRWGLHYVGTPVPHKYPRRPPFGAMAWAWWPKGRLVALRSEDKGSFALWPLFTKGRNVYLNYQTKATGLIKVEVVGEDGNTVAGRSFDDCDPISGNDLNRLVTWKGDSDIKIPENTPVKLRFQLIKTDLFSVRFN